MTSSPVSKLVLCTLFLFVFFLDIGEGLVKTAAAPRVDHTPNDSDPVQPTEDEEVETSITLLLVVRSLAIFPLHFTTPAKMHYVGLLNDFVLYIGILAAANTTASEIHS